MELQEGLPTEDSITFASSGVKVRNPMVTEKTHLICVETYQDVAGIVPSFEEHIIAGRNFFLVCEFW